MVYDSKNFGTNLGRVLVKVTRDFFQSIQVHIDIVAVLRVSTTASFKNLPKSLPIIHITINGISSNTVYSVYIKYDRKKQTIIKQNYNKQPQYEK
jgi:hypothetical protein